VLEWVHEDKVQENPGSEDQESSVEIKEIIFRLFGVTEQGHSICCNVTGFQPYFYLQIPTEWSTATVEKFFNFVKTQRQAYYFRDAITKYTVEYLQDFYGFRGKTNQKYMKFYFSNKRAFYFVRKFLKEPITFQQKAWNFVLYEETVDMTLQFLHTSNFKSVEWLCFRKSSFVTSSDSSCQLEVTLPLEKLKKCSDIFPDIPFGIAPFLQASFDIETYSHDPSRFPEATNVEDKIIQIGKIENFGGLERYLPKGGNC
jgi:DNA polymerase delta subunit 1